MRLTICRLRTTTKRTARRRATSVACNIQPPPPAAAHLTRKKMRKAPVPKATWSPSVAAAAVRGKRDACTIIVTGRIRRGRRGDIQKEAQIKGQWPYRPAAMHDMKY